MEPVIRVKDLKISLAGKGTVSHPVEKVNFEIYKGETLALVGESGSGKSLTALAIMGLLQSWNSYLKPIIEGQIEFTGKGRKKYQLHQLNDKQYDLIRGNDLSMIFQEPLTSLNPVVSIGSQLCEVILTHKKVTKQEALTQAISLLKKVDIPDAENRLNSFPHQFSGGQLQRIIIAMAIACQPRCLIADEPTTALDVTIQDQILKLLRDLQQEQELAILLITHDLGVVSQFADKVAVMYSGNIVEFGNVEQIFSKPVHPYTKMLIQSIPTLETIPGERLQTKQDFLSEKGKRRGELIFDPHNRSDTSFRQIQIGHHVSNAFTKEIES